MSHHSGPLSCKHSKCSAWGTHPFSRVCHLRADFYVLDPPYSLRNSRRYGPVTCIRSMSLVWAPGSVLDSLVSCWGEWSHQAARLSSTAQGTEMVCWYCLLQPYSPKLWVLAIKVGSQCPAHHLWDALFEEEAMEWSKLLISCFVPKEEVLFWGNLLQSRDQKVFVAKNYLKKVIKASIKFMSAKVAQVFLKIRHNKYTDISRFDTTRFQTQHGSSWTPNDFQKVSRHKFTYFCPHRNPSNYWIHINMAAF